MRRVIVALATLTLLPGLQIAHAQSPWSAEISAGAAFPTSEMAGADLGTGVGFEMSARYLMMPHLAVYGGWDWHHFPTDATGPGNDLDVEETGYAFGLRFEHPIAGRVAGWIRAGGTADHIELENGAGDIIADSGHGLGWEAGAGLALPLGDRLRLTPGVRYRALSRDLDIGASEAAVELQYVSIGMGFAFTF